MESDAAAAVSVANARASGCAHSREAGPDKRADEAADPRGTGKEEKGRRAEQGQVVRGNVEACSMRRVGARWDSQGGTKGQEDVCDADADDASRGWRTGGVEGKAGGAGRAWSGTKEGKEEGRGGGGRRKGRREGKEAKGGGEEV